MKQELPDAEEMVVRRPTYRRGPIETKRTVGAMLTGGPPHESLHLAGLLNIHANTRSVAAKG
jgi:hypothetical protein